MSEKSFYDNPGRWVRASEVQEYFGLKAGYTATLWRWVKAGRLPQPQYLNGLRVWRARDILVCEERLLSRTPLSNLHKG